MSDPAAVQTSSLPRSPPPPVQVFGGGTGSGVALVRPRRRAFAAEAPKTQGVVRQYQVHDTPMFTNFKELRNDQISAEYAQEIIEQFLERCGVDTANPRATRMAEDVVFTFYAENAASPKTGHDKVVDVYGVELDMMHMLRILSEHGITPRRFVRGLADRMFEFLRAPENVALRGELARSHGLELADHAAVAFDGSTHITNLTGEYRAVANMLASRGIFDNLAASKNASEATTYEGVQRAAGIRTGVSSF